MRSSRTLFAIATVVLASFLAVSPAWAGVADVGVDTPIPSTDDVIEFTVAGGGVVCLLTPALEYAGSAVVPDGGEPRSTVAKAHLLGTVTVTCNSASPNAYILIQADADLVDTAHGTHYGDGAIPCRPAGACADVSGVWGVTAYPIEYRVRGQVIINTLLPMTSLKGPNCVLHSSTFGDCYRDKSGEIT
jgi:hypothetical protein